VPEADGREAQILAGEAPDPTRIPPGCRFHPRCPVVASGEAQRLGIEERCRGEDLGLAPVPDAAPESLHVAACHAVDAPGRVAATEARARADEVRPGLG
jgi:peptide/nickel transport system ATP-binding protein